MSSSQPFASSPILVSPTTARRRRSRFTYKNLSTLANSSPICPLRVIAHIDLDAFYAQCETVRLGIDPSKPLAVQQWQGLIAINYPARAFGLNRHVTITEAKEKCPDIICQHVATWKEGDTTWEYNDSASKEIATRKVSLDPYRIQSRRILKLIKESLPSDLQRVEKASIDEVFLDLSAQIHAELLKRFPELRGPPPYDDPTEPLPRPSTTVLDWSADALIDLDESQWEEDDPDWDDVTMLIGSEIVRDLRKKVLNELHYTCSAGLAKNKMLAKLGSGHKKPNSQTVVRNRAVQHFLSTFKFTKIRNLGGKLGDEVVAAFNTDAVSDLLQYSVEQLKKQLGDDTGAWLHGVVRGEDLSEVNPRTQIKSMLSAKSFRPSINSFEVAAKWLRIFVADIFSRLVEEGVLEHKRRPRTINLHHRQGQATRSKSAPIPSGKAISEEMLFDLAKNLMAQVVVDGRAWPCGNLSLSVGGFEDSVVGNRGIGTFLIHGDEAKALRASSTTPTTDSEPERKRRRTEDGSGGGIARFFETLPTVTNNIDTADEGADRESALFTNGKHQRQNLPDHVDYAPPSGQATAKPDSGSISPRHEEIVTIYEDTVTCERCGKQVLASKETEHEDFHFAQDLQGEHTPPRPLPKPGPQTSKSKPSNSKTKARPPAAGGMGGARSLEKGQKKLAFG